MEDRSLCGIFWLQEYSAHLTFAGSAMNTELAQSGTVIAPFWWKINEFTEGISKITLIQSL